MPGGQEAQTAQPAARPPCQCDQQLGDALPWLLITMFVIFAVFMIERWSDRRRKRKDKKPDGAAGSGAEDGRSK